MKGRTKYILTGTILTLICVIGGTFAYFTASKSSEEDSVSATAAQLSLGYTDSKINVKTDLIPTAESVAIKYAEEKTCTDANGYSVCSLYEFTVENTSEVKVAIGAILKTNVNTFENLKYRVYETDTISDANLISETKSLELNNGNDIYIEGINKELAVGGKVTYTIVMWVDEIGGNQNLTDGGKDYAGTIEVYAYLPGTSSDDHNKPTGGDIVDTNVPTDNSILINNGDYQTSEGTVTASLKSTGATEVCLTETNDPASCTSNVSGTYNPNEKVVATPLVNKKEAKVKLLTNNTWTSFNEEVTYDLDTTTEGEKTIYAFFKNEAGTSAGVSSTIIYSQDPYLVEEDKAYYYENGKYEYSGENTENYVGYYDKKIDGYYITSKNYGEYVGFYENDGAGNKMYFNEAHNVYMNTDLNLFFAGQGSDNPYHYYIDKNEERPFYTMQKNEGDEQVLLGYSPKEGLYEFTNISSDGNFSAIGYSKDKEKMLYWNMVGVIEFLKLDGDFEYYSDYFDIYFEDELFYVNATVWNEDEYSDNFYNVLLFYDGDIDNCWTGIYYNSKYKKYISGAVYGESYEGVHTSFHQVHDDYYAIFNNNKDVQIVRTTKDMNLDTASVTYNYDVESNMYYSSELDEYFSFDYGIFTESEIIIEPQYQYFFNYDSVSGMYISDEGYYDEDYNFVELEIYYDANGVISKGKFYYKDENDEFVELT